MSLAPRSPRCLAFVRWFGDERFWPRLEHVLVSHHAYDLRVFGARGSEGAEALAGLMTVAVVLRGCGIRTPTHPLK